MENGTGRALNHTAALSRPGPSHGDTQNRNHLTEFVTVSARRSPRVHSHAVRGTAARSARTAARSPATPHVFSDDLRAEIRQLPRQTDAVCQSATDARGFIAQATKSGASGRLLDTAHECSAAVSDLGWPQRHCRFCAVFGEWD
jgi:hypothetical protein